jgi:hypothetical protein
MKTMTCKQLGGACDLEFHAETFEEMAQLSQKHGAEMKEANDQPHIDAMNEMMKMMQEGKVDAWMEEKKQEFNALSED